MNDLLFCNSFGAKREKNTYRFDSKQQIFIRSVLPQSRVENVIILLTKMIIFIEESLLNINM